MCSSDLDRIDGLRAAIRRIDDGSWGECVECGHEIASTRILAVPTTRLCVKCAGKRR